MNNYGISLRQLAVVAVAFAMLVGSTGALASESVIFRFDLANGSYPVSGLIADAKGNLYGTTPSGGHGCSNAGCGTVFELSPGSGGTWTQTILYAFNGTGDGSNPSTDLIFDAKGNLYGATHPFSGNGEVFELTPETNGTWTESVIYSFTQQDGSAPASHLAFDGQGNLYGALIQGGPETNGAVFEISPPATGTWKETRFYAFSGFRGNGEFAYGVVLDSKDDVFGVTATGGSLTYGTAFELTPNGASSWTETDLYKFTDGADGGNPGAPLIIDSAGNLFGTTTNGGADLSGTVFELSQSGGQWTETVLYSFSDPAEETGALVMDPKGNLYGASVFGGNGCNFPGCGYVFELSNLGGGVWKERALHQFQSASDGSEPFADVLFDSAANRLYGVTEYGGGRYGYGTVFAIER